MSEPQDAIDTVLRALRTAEPSNDFESRMHHALQQGTLPERTWRVPSAVLASVALLLGTVAIGVEVRARHAAHVPVAVKPTLTPVPSRVAATHAAHANRALTKTHAARFVHAGLQPQADAGVTVTHVNMPPPPLPLTQEERLVLRMMRHDNLPQLAALSTDARARSLHEDAEAYRAFFAPRPPLDGQPIYDQHIPGGSQ